jgi:DNA-binding transcriptional regulator YiaG
VILRAREAASNADRDREPVTLQQLANELGVNVHTLRDATRDGRLTVQFQKRSIFGKPARRVTRIEGREFLKNGYGRRRGIANRSCPLIAVPNDYSHQLKRLRRRLGLTLSELATKIGAANKAVIYQWESRKRRPSPVLWREVHKLIAARVVSSAGIEPRLIRNSPRTTVEPSERS